jgi:hypothetical protein
MLAQYEFSPLPVRAHVDESSLPSRTSFAEPLIWCKPVRDAPRELGFEDDRIRDLAALDHAHPVDELACHTYFVEEKFLDFHGLATLECAWIDPLSECHHH